MCCPCGFLCCGSDEFGRCGCNDCPDPRCHELDADSAPLGCPVNDNQPEDVPAPLAVAHRAAARFRCEEIV